ncbi:bifunctional 5,10-methylenetetrahydrofolate dehydrogenase/5,10-methenyltetrahydrofolate cyclohydrolase [[Mycobacterium] burgundiense]|uniref:Bifunctional protein FolD n=1 Tax=[Mycobacterium] burgundiense TaxID=3064286 RepID=A0ABM9M4F5_9MYCO|nr:bifunctional 5,10-methylenetetrahydrofolate dehydrogenase/5,10-methenyltetrahydrofolate cyclohydrolase [Mycolicibacterium sp. MU0053]CAJ1510038.1 bifunctional 5,10-methylenetetrahydrofolate dehydrogenase/5,10-methenyltetrahydrofolate cyclohydrolase [Mycolicibacterium sp. MU0053]
MTAILIDGAAEASTVHKQVAAAVGVLDEPPGLATVLVGDDPASAIYVRNKRKRCIEVGMRDLHRHLPVDVSQIQAAEVLDELAADSRVTGILLQLPLPPHLDAAALIDRIPAHKDVDGLTEASAGRLTLGRPGLRPCTPAGILALLDSIGTSLAGAHAVVVGRSNLVGKPVAQMLLQRDCTVTVCHSRTRNLADVCREADVLVAAAGVPGLIGADFVKSGATVIDVGIHRTANGLCGDVNGAVRAVAGVLTPVPGGVGPMTIAMLLRNTADAGTLR